MAVSLRKVAQARPYLFWGGVDQGATSLTTLGLSICVLHETDVEQAFDFSVLLIAYSILVGIARSGTVEPYAVFGGHSQRDEVKKHALAHAAVAGMGSACALLGFIAIYRVHTEAGFFTALAVFVTVTGDAIRQTYVASGDPKRSARYGIFSLAIVTSCGLISLVVSTPLVVIVGWLIGGAAPTIFLLLDGRSPRRFPFSTLRPETFSYLGEYFVTSGSAQAALLIVISLLAPQLAIAHRVLTTAFGPYLVIFQATAVLTVPWMVRRRRSGLYSLLDMALRTQGVLAGVAVSYSAICLLVFAGWGEFVFGSSWAIAVAYLPAFSFALVAGALLAGPLLALRATGKLRLSLSFRMLNGGLQVGLPLTLSAIFGAQGYYLGSAVAGLIAAGAGLFFLRRFSHG